MWNDPRVRKLSLVAKLLAVYLFSNDRAHITGLYFFSPTIAADELDVKLQAVDGAFIELQRAGFCSWDEARRVVWVKNMWKRQPHGGVKIDRLPRYFANLNGSPLVSAFLERYCDDTNLAPLGYLVGGTVPPTTTPTSGTVPPHKIEQEIEQEQEKEVPPSYPPPMGGSDVVTPKTSRLTKPKASHDPEVVRAELEKIDLPSMKRKFPNKDVDACWGDFFEVCLTGTAKKAWPNPYDYVDFSKAFENWLRKRPDRTTNPLEGLR